VGLLVRQFVVAIELFLIPMEGTGVFPTDPFRPKYIGVPKSPQINRFGALRYGVEDSAIVMIDAPNGFLNSVRSQPDVTSLARANNIDNTLTAGQANAAKTIFEGAFIPGQFINAGDTRRQVIRGLAGMFLFSQRIEGKFGGNWKKKAQARGVSLDSTFANFPQVLKDELISVRDENGWTNQGLGVTNQSTMREILKAISDQYENTPISIAGVQI
jgi:hypothetical protein